MKRYALYQESRALGDGWREYMTVKTERDAARNIKIASAALPDYTFEARASGYGNGWLVLFRKTAE